MRALRPDQRPLPMPPYELRRLVGPSEPQSFDASPGEPVFPTIAERHYESVFDFGCGCGRIARQLAVAAAPMPRRYVGIDVHREMIRWCTENLTPRLPSFTFLHHDVYSQSANPDQSLPRLAPFPVGDDSVTLLIAWSLFTHLVQSHAEYYLDEVVRVLAPDGVIIATFFLFDKRYFPMMHDFQNALYVNDGDPTNAVVFDRTWLVDSLESRGLRIRSVRPPFLRGFQWELEVVPGRGSVPFPEDTAPFGRRPPPAPESDADAGCWSRLRTRRGQPRR